MGSTERRARHKEELHRRILEAARSIIMRDGFDALTMRKIAAEIEYSPAAIYLHFTDRDAIARELSREGYAQLYEAMAPAQGIRDPRERLREIGKAYIRFGMENPETYRLIFMEYKYLSAVFGGDVQPDPESDPALKAFNLLIATCAELKSEGLIVSDAEPLTITEAFWAAVHGIVSLKLTCPKFPVSSAEGLEAVMIPALLKGLAGANGRPRAPGRNRKITAITN